MACMSQEMEHVLSIVEMYGVYMMIDKSTAVSVTEAFLSFL